MTPADRTPLGRSAGVSPTTHNLDTRHADCPQNVETLCKVPSMTLETPRVDRALDKAPAPVIGRHAAEEFTVTACDFHGVKVTTDYASFCTYVGFALQHVVAGPDHDDDGGDCWVCCPAMVIDPDGRATVAEAAARLGLTRAATVLTGGEK